MRRSLWAARGGASGVSTSSRPLDIIEHMFESSAMTARRLDPAPRPAAPIRVPSPPAPRPLPPVARAPRPALPDRLAERARPLALAGDRRLPLAPALVPLLGADGLRRGTTVVVTAASGDQLQPGS